MGGGGVEGKILAQISHFSNFLRVKNRNNFFQVCIIGIRFHAATNRYQNLTHVNKWVPNSHICEFIFLSGFLPSFDVAERTQLCVRKTVERVSRTVTHINGFLKLVSKVPTLNHIALHIICYMFFPTSIMHLNHLNQMQQILRVRTRFDII